MITAHRVAGREDMFTNCESPFSPLFHLFIQQWHCGKQVSSAVRSLRSEPQLCYSLTL